MDSVESHIIAFSLDIYPHGILSVGDTRFTIKAKCTCTTHFFNLMCILHINKKKLISFNIHSSNKSVVTKEPISSFAAKLPAEFLRIHRSFIVNTKKVTAFTKVDVEINETEIPIGSSYKEAVMIFLKKG